MFHAIKEIKFYVVSSVPLSTDVVSMLSAVSFRVPVSLIARKANAPAADKTAEPKKNLL
jgi:hypothetical protein